MSKAISASFQRIALPKERPASELAQFHLKQSLREGVGLKAFSASFS